MNFRQLKAFDTVMRLGSITGAAKEMRVSQPSVTRLIHELESGLGFTLFVRRGRGIAATSNDLMIRQRQSAMRLLATYRSG
ncbi:MAG: LysR family transcriptional regulator [Alphaproteobacteria bacterium]